MLTKRLDNYFNEARKHSAKINGAMEVLKTVMPLETYGELSELHQDKLDILVFRFSKLQDLLGDKIFRTILEYSGFNTQRPFIELLSELERENLLELNHWIELREARNKIAHDYPDDEVHIVESINFIYTHVTYLMELVETFNRYYDAITDQRTH
jgi:hypothetical protein